jgi:hypothetical protein
MTNYQYYQSTNQPNGHKANIDGSTRKKTKLLNHLKHMSFTDEKKGVIYITPVV